jgi:hypothetical protein
MKQQPTLDLVLQMSHGALLVPLKKTASILGLETQTVRNRLCEKRFELSIVKIGRRNFFRAADIAAFIDSTSQAPQKAARGRPRKSALAGKARTLSAGE